MTREPSRTVRCCAGILLIVFSCCSPAVCINNGLALTPPMGYNTWNAYHDDIDEHLIFSAADILVESGLAAAGYNYLNIDGACNSETPGRYSYRAFATQPSCLCLA